MLFRLSDCSGEAFMKQNKRKRIKTDKRCARSNISALIWTDMV